jgi:hypothetical protein
MRQEAKAVAVGAADQAIESAVATEGQAFGNAIAEPIARGNDIGEGAGAIAEIAQASASAKSPLGESLRQAAGRRRAKASLGEAATIE